MFHYVLLILRFAGARFYDYTTTIRRRRPELAAAADYDILCYHGKSIDVHIFIYMVLYVHKTEAVTRGVEAANARLIQSY